MRSLRSPSVDANLVAPNLSVGARPPYGKYRWINVIVLCAREFQPPSYAYPGATVIRVPLDDNPLEMSEVEKSLAITNAKTIARYLQGGSRVLVTCHKGINRSALIAGLAMQFVWDLPADEVIGQIRESRDRRCLSNPQFVRLLRRVERQRSGS